MSRLQGLATGLKAQPFAGTADDVLERLDALLADIGTLSKLPELHRLRTSLEAAKLSELLQSLEARPINRDEVEETLQFAWLTSLVEHLQLSAPGHKFRRSHAARRS